MLSLKFWFIILYFMTIFLEIFLLSSINTLWCLIGLVGMTIRVFSFLLLVNNFWLFILVNLLMCISGAIIVFFIFTIMLLYYLKLSCTFDMYNNELIFNKQKFLSFFYNFFLLFLMRSMMLLMNFPKNKLFSFFYKKIYSFWFSSKLLMLIFLPTIIMMIYSLMVNLLFLMSYINSITVMIWWLFLFFLLILMRFIIFLFSMSEVFFMCWNFFMMFYKNAFYYFSKFGIMVFMVLFSKCMSLLKIIELSIIYLCYMLKSYSFKLFILLLLFFFLPIMYFFINMFNWFCCAFYVTAECIDPDDPTDMSILKRAVYGLGVTYDQLRMHHIMNTNERFLVYWYLAAYSIMAFKLGDYTESELEYICTEMVDRDIIYSIVDAAKHHYTEYTPDWCPPEDYLKWPIKSHPWMDFGPSLVRQSDYEPAVSIMYYGGMFWLFKAGLPVLKGLFSVWKANLGGDDSAGLGGDDTGDYDPDEAGSDNEDDVGDLDV